MNLSSWLTPRNRSRRNPLRCTPRVHELEDRTVPAGSDLFANATVLTGSFDTGSNVGATGEAGEPNHAGTAGDLASVWWQWTAPDDGTVEFNTNASDFDTVLAVYTGSDVTALDEVASNDDDAGSQSRVQFPAVAGTTYYIAVDGFGTDTGNIILNVGMTPANDNFSSATTFSGTSLTGSNLLATDEAGEPAPFGNGSPVNSVWWQWTAPADGLVEVNTDGSNFDTNLAVYTGFSDAALLSSNDDYNGLLSRVTFTAEAGTTYYFVVDGFGAETGSIVLNMPTSPAPTNHLPTILGQSLSVNENSAFGVVVGTVVASDPDAGQTLSYAITGGNAGGAFAIDSATGVVSVANASALNFETTTSINLVVQVTDSGSPSQSDSAGVLVHINDVNEAPTFAISGPYSTPENTSAGTIIGFALATDVDAGQSLTYSFTSGNTGGAFAINPSTGLITVANSAALNFETAPSFALTVLVTDNGSPTKSASTVVLINLSDINESPVIANQTFNVPASSPAGTVVGSAPATDPDAGQTLTYSITAGNSTGAFAINAATGQITVANAAALASLSSVVLTVRATDNGSPVLAATASVAITVTGGTVVLTPQEQISLLLGDIKDLIGGSFNSGQANALQSSLNTALSKLNQGNTTAAVNTLQAFINKVQAQVKAGNLSSADGQDLINAANEAIASVLS